MLHFKIIAVVAFCCELGRDNTLMALQTGNATETVLSTISSWNSTLPGKPATFSGFITSSLSRTEKNKSMNRTTLSSKREMNWMSNIGTGNDAADSRGNSSDVLQNASFGAARNRLVGGSSNILSQTLLKNDRVEKHLNRNMDVLLDSASGYNLGTFKGKTRYKSHAKRNADRVSLPKKILNREVVSFLTTHNSNDSYPAFMSVSDINHDTNMTFLATHNSNVSNPAFMSVSDVNHDTNMTFLATHNSNVSNPAFMSVSDVNHDTNMTFLATHNSNVSNPAFMSVSDINHDTNMTFLATHNSNDSYPAFMSVSDVNHDTNMTAVMSVPGSVNNETTTQEITQVSTGEGLIPDYLDGITSNVDDPMIFSVELGDFSFAVCSELTVCRNRCSDVSSYTTDVQHSGRHYTTDVQHSGRNKRQTFISDEHYNKYKKMSQNFQEKREIQKIYVQKRQHPKSKGEKETEIHHESEQYSKFTTKTKARQTFQHGLRLRDKRSANGNISNAECTNMLNNYTCFCDDDCVIHGDCCVDVFQSCFSKTNTEDIVEIISDITEKVHFNTTSANLVKMLKDNSENTDSILSSFLSNFASCEKIDWGKYVYLVSLCPANFTDSSLRTKCEKPEVPLLPPVTANVSNEFISFRNTYCAQCHGIGTERLQPWLVNLECQKSFDSNIIHLLTIKKCIELVTTKECNVTFTKPLGTCEPRPCEPGYRLSQEHKQQIVRNVLNGMCSSDDALLCQTYYILGNPIRNPSCERCLDSVNSTHRTGEIINACNLTNPYINPPPRNGGSNPTGGILIILDITGVYSDNEDKSTFYVCEDDEVFDPFFLQCKSLICSSGFQPFRGKCVDSSTAFFVPESSQIFPDGWSRLDILTTTSETTNGYISCGQIFENTEAKLPHKHFIVDKVLINDYKDFNGTVPENISTSFFRCEEHITEQQSDCLQSVDFVLSITHDINLETIDELESLAKSLIPLRSDDDGFRISISNILNATRHADACAYGRILAQRSDFSLAEYKGVAYAVFTDTREGVYYPLGNIGYEFTIAVPGKAGNSMAFLYNVYICQERELLFRKNCSVVEYLINETKQEGSRLLIKKSSEYYNEGEFYTTEDRVYVCSNFEFKIHQENGTTGLTYIIITCTMTSLSVVCLLIMLVIYCVFPELRSLPGKMSATLAGTMMLTFLANLFTLTELHNDYICPVLAAVSHVITLSHFGWMAAISVNMALTFGPGIHSLLKSHDDSKVYIRYSVIVWGISLAIVLTSVVMDFTHRGDNTTPNLTASSDTGETVSSVSTSNYPRYGDPFCTWFSGPLWARLSFVVIPYFITYIISSTGFLLTLVGIHQSKKNLEKVGHKTSEKTLCLIYVKLSTAMGFAWILSVVVSFYPDSQVLPYIYVCLVLLQGVLLFLAFTANKKVYSLIMRKYLSAYKTSSKDGTQISSVMTNTL